MAPPTLKGAGTTGKKFKGLGKAPAVGSGVQLPNIYSAGQGPSDSGPPRPPIVPSKLRSKLQANTGKVKPQTQFDHTLLREAFAYTDKLLKDAIMEEAAAGIGGDFIGENDATRPLLKGSNSKKGIKGGAPTAQPKLASKTAPMESAYMAPYTDHQGGGGRKKGDSAGRERKSVVKRMRAKIPSESAMYTANNDTEGAFNTTGDTEADQGRRNPINFDELVSNFEGGLTLQKLRKELEQSKQSMKKSENFMKQLSMEYLGSGRL